MKTLNIFPVGSCILAFLLTVGQAWADGPVRILLDNDFIKDYADRATIKAQFTIDKAHARPNPPSKDGDMHIAGRAPEIGLACVAELMNAKYEADELSIIREEEGSGAPVTMIGAWRIWCEHAGGTAQKQKRGSIGSTAFSTTNPDHVFEIHPVLSINDESSSTGWRPIDGFRAKDAHDSFVTYENVACTIVPGENQTEIRTGMAGYNYVEFVLERDDEHGHEMKDESRTVFCKIRDLDGELLVRKCRAVFVKGTDPFEKLGSLDNGERMHVLGIPRISLALLQWRIENKDNAEYPDVLKWSLPYEILIVGAYGSPDHE